MSESLMTTEELSEFLQVPIGTIYQWRHRGEGPPAIPVGRHLRWRRSEVERWLQERAATSTGRGDN